MTTDITRHHTGDRMSQIVIHNGTIYLAGQVGNPGDSVADQTRTCKCTIWLADMSDFAEMNAVWDAWVPKGHAPARACGEAKLATPDYRVELLITAAQG